MISSNCYNPDKDDDAIVIQTHWKRRRWVIGQVVGLRFCAYSSCLLYCYMYIDKYTVIGGLFTLHTKFFFDEYWMRKMNCMNDMTAQILVALNFLLISINITNALTDIPTRTFHDRSSSMSKLSNQTATLYTWKKLHSSQIFKKSITNRQNMTKFNRTFLLTSKYFF